MKMAIENNPPSVDLADPAALSQPPAVEVEKIPDLLEDDSISVDVSGVIAENLKNYAEDEDVVKEVKARLSTVWSNISDRQSYEDVWEKVDEMYRVKPSGDITEKNRANFGSGVFTRSINQLVGIAYQILVENKHKYKYIPRPSIVDQGTLDQARKNAAILTDMLHIAMDAPDFKRNMRKILYGIYKYGKGLCGIPFRREKKAWKIKNGKDALYSVPVLPVMEHIPIENLYADTNIDGLQGQDTIFIKALTTWSALRGDTTVVLPKDTSKKGDAANKAAVDQFKATSGDTTETVKESRFGNAEHDYNDKDTGLIRHWVVWAMLPIDTEKGKWDEAGEWKLFRVRILGDADKCEVIECRENPFPGGMPLLDANQCEDDIGFYHISLGEKVETYHDQICTAQNQLADNRSKINRRSLFYNSMMVSHQDRIDYGHSNAIPVEGNPREAIYEMEMIDITGTITNTIIYNENKIKEIMNTTDAILGVAMGGRTSASEYQGARMAATTPIYADLSVIEESIMASFMDKFAQYVHAFMTPADIIYFVGEEGRSFDFTMTGKDYSVVAEGVVYSRDKAMRMQNLAMLLQLTTDATIRAKIMRRMADAMELDNPEEITRIPGYDQAVKAALFENVAMLEYGNLEAPQPGENHDIHLPIHTKAYMDAKREKNPNTGKIGHHIRETMNLRKQEQSPPNSGLLSEFGPRTAQGAEVPVADNFDVEMPQQAGTPIPA